MTVGFWYEEARSSLRAAQDAMSGRHAGMVADIHAVISARTATFTQLARMTELLIGGRPTPDAPNRTTAAVILDRQGQSLTRLFVGLQAAAPVSLWSSPPPPDTSGLARSLRRAADAVGVIGDIVASHAPPRRRPRTPEGAALRAGGGVHAALGDVARLAVEAIALDAKLPAWLNRGQDPLADIYRPVVEAAQWTVNSRLRAAARDLIASAAGQPALLRELDIARAPLDPAPAVTTADEATAAVTVARTWLWQNPNQVAAAHLQITAQLGLAVHTLKSGVDAAALRFWRDAAIAASELRGTPAVDLARNASAELVEVLRWARSQLHPDQHEPAQEHTRQATRLGKELPSLAATMHRGLRYALQRQDVFVRDAVLRRPVGALIYLATERWRPATRDDDPVRDLSRALWQAHKPDTAGGTPKSPNRIAAQSFPCPPRPDGSLPEAPALPAPRHGPTAVPRRPR